MFDDLNDTQKRYLAIGFMLLTMLTITLGIVVPLLTGYAENQARITQLQQQLKRYQDAVASRPVIMTQTAELKNTILGTGIFSRQHSVSLVLAELQKKVTAVITAAGGELDSTQNLAQPPIKAGLMKLGINASFSGNIDHLRHILFELETAKPYLILENIKIYGAGNRPVVQGNVGAANKIRVVADIVTYIPSISK